MISPVYDSAILSPIALDLEWRLLFTRQYNTASWTVLKRRAAVVQVADSSGLILIIQVYNMSRMSAILFASRLTEMLVRISD